MKGGPVLKEPCGTCYCGKNMFQVCSIVFGPADGPLLSHHRTDSHLTFNHHHGLHSSSCRKGGGDEEAHQSIGADIESLHKQLRIVDQRLSTLTGKLEVLRAVQQALPTARGK